MARVSRISFTLLSYLTFCTAVWSACGDDGRPGEAGSATATDTTPQTTTTTPTTGDSTPTGSATATATEGSVSDTATGTSNGPTSATDSATATDSASTTDSATTATTATTGEPAGPCSEDPPPGFMAPFDADCKTEPQLGMFDPVVEWHKDIFMNSPGANASASAPIVVQVNDDNMDGKINSEDMPDILNVISIV